MQADVHGVPPAATSPFVAAAWHRSVWQDGRTAPTASPPAGAATAALRPRPPAGLAKRIEEGP